MRYTNDALKEIVFPLGGIGSGCIGLKGNGQLVDFEIFNRPNKNSYNGYTHLAIRTVDSSGKVDARVLNGDLTTDLVGVPLQKCFSGFGFGPSSCTMCGFPHFRDCTFDGDFPFADITLGDKEFKGSVAIRAFNPMIPNDALNSSIPAAFFRISYINDTEEPLDVDMIFVIANPFISGNNSAVCRDGISAVKLFGKGSEYDPEVKGDVVLATADSDANVQTHWYRGGWQDGVVTYWNEITSGSPFVSRSYKTDAKGDHALICVRRHCAPHETVSAEYVLSWNIPECRNYWDKTASGDVWKNYYATVWQDAFSSAAYSLQHFKTLEKRSDAFRRTLSESTLDPVVLEAAINTLSVLKSPTVMRLEGGEFYGWEGVHEKAGSCEGTCQHVWNYAYALCFLYPELERSIRDLQFRYNMDNDGGMQFRLKLPLGSERGSFHCCVDGQMGEIIKVWREWKLSGDTEWMIGLYPYVKKAISYAWSENNADKWDISHSGVLTGRQHHTLDVELFGPSSWLEGFYLLALKACAELSDAAGDVEFAEHCRALYENGSRYTETQLFNGSYFIQRIDLNDLDIPRSFGAENYVNKENGEIKYQIGEGCEIDQMCAQWHANILGLGRIFRKEQTMTALRHMFKNNFKPSMRHHTNPWRVFALNDEAGSIICDYPKGVYKPQIPIPYCEEAMHGFEYQFAGLLISEGMVDEGIAVVRAVRERYRGYNRNPWNEIECGSNYARSMAAFALLPIFSGFHFDLPAHEIGFSPITDNESFKCFFSVDGAWGIFTLNKHSATLAVVEGKLVLRSFVFGIERVVSAVKIDGTSVSFENISDRVNFDTREICEKLELMFDNGV